MGETLIRGITAQRERERERERERKAGRQTDTDRQAGRQRQNFICNLNSEASSFFMKMEEEENSLK